MITSKTTRIALIIVFAIVAFVPLLLNHTIGADFEEYLAWAKAFKQTNIFCLEQDVLSPMGIPLSQWAFGPGLIFSLGSFFTTIHSNAAVLVGWVFAVIFWISYVGILLRVTNNNRSLALFGACITFIGTPIGYYSSTYASESLSYTCLSILIYWILSRDRFNVFDYWLVGIWVSFLLIIRIQLAIYTLPIYYVIICRIWRDIKLGDTTVIRSCLVVITSQAPVFLALLSISIVNYWMTGSPLGSVYDFGYGDFKSIDFLHPELAAVLVHPLHGLFAYHPLYLIGFTTFVVALCKENNRLRQLLYLVTTLVIMLHIYLHAAWYAWWLGLSTFGMRGLSISGIVVIPLLLKLMSEREERGKSNKALVTLIFIANLWSYAILTQGTSQYYTYQELFSGIIAACENLVAINAITLPATVLVLGSLAKLLRFPKPFSSITVTIILTTVLLLLVTIYQITQLYFASGGMLVVSLMSLVAMLVILNGYPVVIEEFQKHCHLLQKIFFAVSAICFIAISIIFTNLSVVTNRIIASKVPASREYARISKFNIDEVKITYNEYLNVPGFDDKKTRLADFIYMVENSPAQLR